MITITEKWNRIRTIQAFFFLALLGLLGTGCGIQRELDETEWMAFLANPENGLVKERQFENVVWRLQFGQAATMGLETQPSLSGQESKSLIFLLNVAPGRIYGGGDVMMNGAASYQAYDERMIQLNFRMQEMLRLNWKGKEYEPVLAHMENTFGLSQDRKIHVVFSSKDFPSQLSDFGELDIRLADQVFGTGINHFHYDAEEMSRIPMLRQAHQELKTTN